MHSRRMRTARLRIVPVGGGREVLYPGLGGMGEGGVVSWVRGEVGVVSWSREGGREGGRCCDLVMGGGGGSVPWFQGGGVVVSWSLGGGRCCFLVPAGREVLCSGPGGGGGGRCCVLVLGGRKGGRCCDLVAHLPPAPELNSMSDTHL